MSIIRFRSQVFCALALFGYFLVVLYLSLRVREFSEAEMPIIYVHNTRYANALTMDTIAVTKDANVTVSTPQQWMSHVRKVPIFNKQPLTARFPTYMIIGFGKAGTRALYDLLRLHPKLSGPSSEERFFSLHYSLGLHAYLHSLPRPPTGGYTIEKSPDYIISSSASNRIIESARSLGIEPSGLKFIVVLRDPIDRAVSEYLEWQVQRKKNHQKDLPPFPEMVVTKDLQVDASRPFLNTSCYAAHISHWMKAFPREQICFVDGDVFNRNPFKEVHELEECMGLQHFFTEDNFVYDPIRGHFCFQVKEKKCMKKSKGRAHPSVPSNVLMKLKEFFRPWNEQLPELTGKEWLFLQDT